MCDQSSTLLGDATCLISAHERAFYINRDHLAALRILMALDVLKRKAPDGDAAAAIDAYLRTHMFECAGSDEAGCAMPSIWDVIASRERHEPEPSAPRRRAAPVTSRQL